jgi:hypothetical protein
LNSEEILVILMTLLILAGVLVLWMAMHSRRRIREMEHRERLAMIERGLIPPPELEPAVFERRAGIGPRSESPAASRSRSSGVILIGFGLGLTLLISFAAGEPEVGIGIGGAFAVLGGAFLVNAMLATPQHPPDLPSLRQRSSAIDRPEPPSTTP